MHEGKGIVQNNYKITSCKHKNVFSLTLITTSKWRPKQNKTNLVGQPSQYLQIIEPKKLGRPNFCKIEMDRGTENPSLVNFINDIKIEETIYFGSYMFEKNQINHVNTTPMIFSPCLGSTKNGLGGM